MGGGAIRAAAKAAAFRSPAIFANPAVHRFPRSNSDARAAPAAKKADVGLSVLTSDNARSEAWVQRPAFELDDWEFAGLVEEEGTAGRVVFGPVPSFEEAKAATFDLRDSIERYHTQTASANSAVNCCRGSMTSEASSIIPQMPPHVVQAFSFLQASPEAQDVVASLASDVKIWSAVMSNAKVMEFIQKHQTVSTPAESDVESTSSSPIASSTIEDFYQSFKTKVEEVVNNISVFFQDILANSPGLCASAGAAKSLQSNIVSYTEPPVGVGASLFALAIATILVVLFKRA